MQSAGPWLAWRQTAPRKQWQRSAPPLPLPPAAPTALAPPWPGCLPAPGSLWTGRHCAELRPGQIYCKGEAVVQIQQGGCRSARCLFLGVFGQVGIAQRTTKISLAAETGRWWCRHQGARCDQDYLVCHNIQASLLHGAGADGWWPCRQNEHWRSAELVASWERRVLDRRGLPGMQTVAPPLHGAQQREQKAPHT